MPTYSMTTIQGALLRVYNRVTRQVFYGGYVNRSHLHAPGICSQAKAVTSAKEANIHTLPWTLSEGTQSDLGNEYLLIERT